MTSVWRNRVSLDARSTALFFRQLATLVGTGVPITSSLQTLSEQPDHPQFGLVVKEMTTQVSQGKSLSFSMGQYPRVFPKLAVNLMRVAEKTGSMHAMLAQLADWQERDHALRQRLFVALSYPLLVLTITAALMLVLMLLVVPTFSLIFQGMGVPLPLLTRCLLGAAQALRNPGLWFSLSAALILASNQSQEAAEYGFRLLRNLPWIGPALVKMGCCRYCLAASVMLNAGMDLQQTCILAAEASGNGEFQEDSSALCISLTTGRSLAQHLRQSPEIYPPTLTAMIKVGEESSRLPDMLQRASRFYDFEASCALDTFASALEPILLGLVSLAVATMLLAIFLPMSGYLQHFSG